MLCKSSLWYGQTPCITCKFDISVSVQKPIVTIAFKVHSSLPIGDGREIDLLVCHPGLNLQQTFRLMNLNPPSGGINALCVRALPVIQNSYLEIEIMERLRGSISSNERATG
jgi:hypothetical protein